MNHHLTARERASLTGQQGQTGRGPMVGASAWAGCSAVAQSENVIPQMLAWRKAGHRAVLVTVLAVEGPSPRPPGSQMAVHEDGTFIGQITSGCAERTIVCEALATLHTRTARDLRLGRGSAFMDIRLPCGSGLDIRLDPGVELDSLERLVKLQQHRRPAELLIPRDSQFGPVSVCERPDVTRPVSSSQLITESGDRTDSAAAYRRLYEPQTRLVLAGRGPILTALIGFGCLAGFDIAVATPDAHGLATAHAFAVPAHHLNGPQDFDASLIDPWTAAALLFHDHDWEPPLLKQILARSGFYIGALGSRRAHQERLSELQRLGVTPEETSKIRGPIGLDLGGRAPHEIAVSVLADVIAARHGK